MEQSHMNTQEIMNTAKALVADLAMDESNPTCDKRFATLGIPQTSEAHRTYREMIVTTPSLCECISGAILYDDRIVESGLSGHAQLRRELHPRNLFAPDPLGGEQLKA